MSSIAHLFFEVHMAYSHDTLRSMVLKKSKQGLADGETAIFINRKWTAVKLLTKNNTILYHRDMKNGINPETIRHLPSCVEGGELNYAKALATVLTSKFGKPKA